MSSFTIPESYGKLSLMDFLRKQKVSLTLRRKLKQGQGTLLLNGSLIPWQTELNPGEVLTVAWPEESRIKPIDMPLSVVYEDESLLVVDKPSGLLVHPTTDIARPSLANAVMHYLQSQGVAAGFHPVHRLDRNTSGLIMIAKNPYVQHLFSGEAGLKINRKYSAVIHGTLTPPAGIIDAPIGRRDGSIIERTVRSDGQPAITSYETIKAAGEYSLVRLSILTGRTHQIRVHLSFKGHPICGDDLYGGSLDKIARQALHAAELSFIHPLSGLPVNLTCPLPPDMLALIDDVGMNINSS